MLTACGGNDSGSTPVEIHGIWRGTVDNRPLIGMIDQDGPSIFFDAAGQTYAFSHIREQQALSESGFYNAPWGELLDESPSTFAQLTGTASTTDLSGTFDWTLYGANGQPQTQATQHFRVQPYDPLGGFAVITAATWSGYYVDNYRFAPTPTSLSIDVKDGGGTFTGIDMDSCTLSGEILPVLGEEFFEVEFKSTGVSGSGCSDDMTGLGYESDTDEFGKFGHASGRYFYMALTSRNVLDGPTEYGFVIEFKVQ